MKVTENSPPSLEMLGNFYLHFSESLNSTVIILHKEHGTLINL